MTGEKCGQGWPLVDSGADEQTHALNGIPGSGGHEPQGFHRENEKKGRFPGPFSCIHPQDANLTS